MFRRVFPAVIILLLAFVVVSGAQNQSVDRDAPAQTAISQAAGQPSGSIGVSVRPGNQPAEQASKIVVDYVIEDGPAGKAGLKAGDIIVSVDGRAVGNAAEFGNPTKARAIGSTVTIGYVRNGQQFETRVTLVERNKLYTTWLMKGSEQGDPRAQVQLAQSFMVGDFGLAKNETQAAYWYRKAAEQGNAIAQNNLGNMYFNGQGVPQDYAQAAAWYRKAAEQGEANAQLLLGWAYETGSGVPKDSAQAVYWYEKAVAQGSEAAKADLARLAQPPRSAAQGSEAAKAGLARLAQPAKKKQVSETPQADIVPPQTSAMTIWQARKLVAEALQQTLYSQGHGASEIKIRPESIEVRDAPGTPYAFPDTKLDLRTPGTFSIGASSYKKGYHQTFYVVKDGHRVSFPGLWWWDLDEDRQAYATVRTFAAALNRVSAYARGERTPEEDAVWRDFPQKAAAWRALTVKPPISEEVREHRILAENAFREKNLNTAIDEYEAGLALNPVWPEGHFNAALLCAELGFYEDAIEHMRAYVELVPEAPDAQQGGDQIVTWKAKLSQ